MWKQRTMIGFLLVAVCSLASVLASEPKAGPTATITKISADVPVEKTFLPIVTPAMAWAVAYWPEEEIARPIFPRVIRARVSAPREEARGQIILTATTESSVAPALLRPRPIVPPPGPLALAFEREPVKAAPLQAPSATVQEGRDDPASYVLEEPESDTVYQNNIQSHCNCQDCCRGTSGIGKYRCVKKWWLTEAKPCLQESHWGYADQFEVRPFGSYANAHFNKQIANGILARLALYHYDFGDVKLRDPSKLNARGRKRLGELAGMMVQSNVYPLIIQSSPGKPELDAARLAHVLELTGGLESPLPADWIVVGTPIPTPLSGEEAIMVQENMLRRTQSGEPPQLEKILSIGGGSSGGGGR
jgi:hypothetical protein